MDEKYIALFDQAENHWQERGARAVLSYVDSFHKHMEMHGVKKTPRIAFVESINYEMITVYFKKPLFKAALPPFDIYKTNAGAKIQVMRDFCR